jgi:hypothetical protein
MGDHANAKYKVTFYRFYMQWNWRRSGKRSGRMDKTAKTKGGCQHILGSSRECGGCNILDSIENLEKIPKGECCK